MLDFIDEKDLKVVEALKEDGSLTARGLSKKTKLPIATANNRVRKLKKNGVIKRFTIELDNLKIGKSFCALILVSVDYGLLREMKTDQHQLAKKISVLEEVEQVDVVTGVNDLVVRVRLTDVCAFDEFLLKKFQKIPGIDKTQSLVIIHET